jgi:RNA polymerase sigma-70 factor, ECF subfamily
MPTAYAHEHELVAAARRGDEGAFRSLVERYRAELHAHCYRMLGSLHDAEDALQDALLRAWRGLPRFQGRSSLRTWLYRLATNTCLDLIARRQRRMLPVEHGPPADPLDGKGRPLAETVWVEPYPDEVLGLPDGFASPEARYERRESVELAFIAALQHLPASQRAVLILRDVLGFSAREAAASLDTTVASVNSSLQRARKAVDERLPEHSQQATLRSLGDAAVREVVERYVAAWERGDIAAIVAMLAEDAALTMPPLANWYRGRDGIGAFLAGFPLSGEWSWRHVPARANGQPAIGCYAWEPGAGAHLPFALEVLSLEGGQLAEIDAFVTRSTRAPAEEILGGWAAQPAEPSRVAGLFERFGLPARLD